MQIIIPTSLRTCAEGASEIDLEATSVAEALEKAFGQYPDLCEALMDEQGALRSHINLFVNDRNIRNLEGSETKLAANDELLILGALAGG
ncbi:MoaD/ThiS family protein [Blastopirellula sp. JC732]|uniref:MoaD/ThiS family protein n=1 Tax=Blastopirellula sediminis TaxID=2894196 RepID=A0A9X1SJD5_9BACT|nr:MoaD/ThiS family protein [Blastopirellula sediminis]MCC9608409.1 MoaD/ThiS family protein [Blastopirellula sediminis]MCC9628814.1 MoaD/ThiS family protein [Blastopirellula sediminis]